MSDEAGPSEDSKSITFNIKSSSDQKHAVTVPESMTVLDLKNKLSTSEFADIPADRQRLIYSGRVLKDHDSLATYNIKDGNTVHMVKGAASNQRQDRPAASSTASPPGAGVPQNLASGTGNDPLAGLTGARYAGFAQMPGADMFGPDGGMGPPPGPDQMLDMLDNPMFQSQMNEAMNNPAVIQMMQNSPMMRNQPYLREMLNNPEMRRMMMDPNIIRQSMQMQRMLGGGNAPGQSNMPAPGVTDTTPQAQRDSAASTQNPASPESGQGVNPFAAFAGAQGSGADAGAGAGANPFAALFGSPNPMNPTSNANSTTTLSNPSDSATFSSNQPSTGATNSASQQQPQNPLAALLAGMAPPQGGGAPGSQDGNNMAQLMQQMMQGMGGMGGLGGFGGGGSGAAPAPADSRPPEEQYADQLRQLNDMGFFEFDRNVRALRMSGGRVEGAVEILLGGTV